MSEDSFYRAWNGIGLAHVHAPVFAILTCACEAATCASAMNWLDCDFVRFVGLHDGRTAMRALKSKKPGLTGLFCVMLDGVGCGGRI
ncbi:hypothetical protein [Caballeronia sp. S22]|uniref:hypothetical protein n=1 Tax=Caballeronia sp. S22 TaxID=3137182 RepID=UPI0035310083